LKLTPAVLLGAFAIPQLQKPLLKAGLGFSDWASARLFRSGHSAHTFADSDLTPFAKFPINDYDVDDPGVIFENWSLAVSGAVQRPGDYKLGQIQALPRVRQNTRHICVEGWDYIGQWSGPNLRAFLTRVGADLTAKYVYFICNDDFTESIDMASALHPQTILATKYADRLITDPFGYPLRLRTSTKLGYKNAKWIKSIEVTNDFRETFWSKQGFNWFAGI